MLGTQRILSDHHTTLDIPSTRHVQTMTQNTDSVSTVLKLEFRSDMRMVTLPSGLLVESPSSLTLGTSSAAFQFAKDAASRLYNLSPALVSIGFKWADEFGDWLTITTASDFAECVRWHHHSACRVAAARSNRNSSAAHELQESSASDATGGANVTIHLAVFIINPVQKFVEMTQEHIIVHDFASMTTRFVPLTNNSVDPTDYRRKLVPMPSLTFDDAEVKMVSAMSNAAPDGRTHCWEERDEDSDHECLHDSNPVDDMEDEIDCAYPYIPLNVSLNMICSHNDSDDELQNDIDVSVSRSDKGTMTCDLQSTVSVSTSTFIIMRTISTNTESTTSTAGTNMVAKTVSVGTNMVAETASVGTNTVHVKKTKKVEMTPAMTHVEMKPKSLAALSAEQLMAQLKDLRVKDQFGATIARDLSMLANAMRSLEDMMKLESDKSSESSTAGCRSAPHIVIGDMDLYRRVGDKRVPNIVIHHVCEGPECSQAGKYVQVPGILVDPVDPASAKTSPADASVHAVATIVPEMMSPPPSPTALVVETEDADHEHFETASEASFGAAHEDDFVIVDADDM